MGWTGEDLHDDWTIWTRGGFEGVYISNKNSDERIEIPAHILLEWAAGAIIANRIDRLEGMEPDDILREVGLLDD